MTAQVAPGERSATLLLWSVARERKRSGKDGRCLQGRMARQDLGNGYLYGMNSRSSSHGKARLRATMNAASAAERNSDWSSVPGVHTPCRSEAKPR